MQKKYIVIRSKCWFLKMGIWPILAQLNLDSVFIFTAASVSAVERS